MPTTFGSDQTFTTTGAGTVNTKTLTTTTNINETLIVTKGTIKILRLKVFKKVKKAVVTHDGTQPLYIPAGGVTPPPPTPSPDTGTSGISFGPFAKHTAWRFVLIKSDTMATLYDLNQARSRQVEIIHNRPGTASFTLPLDHESAYLVEPHSTALRVVKNGQTVWTGPVYSIQENGDANQLSVSCMGWSEELNHRIVRQIYDQTSPLDQTKVWTNTPASDIIFNLLQIANTQRDGLLGNGTPRQTRIVQGTANLTDLTNFPLMPRFNFRAERGQNIWSLIQQLLDVENGLDMVIDPVTRAMNLYYPKFGSDKTNIVTGFNWGPKNLSNVTRTVDGTKTMNRMTAYGKYGAGFAEDTDSMNTFGVMFEEEAQLSDITDSNVLLGYAGAEVVLRSIPTVTHDLTLFPAADFVPDYLTDFVVGDTISFSAKKGRLNIDKQAVRVFGTTITIDENGSERITQLSISPTS